jgi:hypothetical protein
MVAFSIAISNSDNIVKLGEYDLNCSYWSNVICNGV